MPSSLLYAAFELPRVCGWTLPRAVATVSANPARSVGLNDRGNIGAGQRADLVRVRLNGYLPVPVSTYRQGERVA